MKNVYMVRLEEASGSETNPIKYKIKAKNKKEALEKALKKE